MSTFERMLEVLGARDAGRRNTFIADLLARVLADQTQSASRRSRRRAARNRRRNERQAVATESLERRQLLALTTFAESTVGGGWTTIVAESGDNVFLQEVATSPKSIYVSDNSSFINRTVIGGPSMTDNPMVSAQFHTGKDVSLLDAISITTGTKRRDLSLDAQGYPMVSQGVTRFTLAGDKLITREPTGTKRNLSGRFSLVQPDGTRTYWDFNNEFDYDPRLTNGIGVNQEVKPGFYYPTAVFALNEGLESRKGEIEVRWNVPQLPRESEPLLEAVSWYQSSSRLTDAVAGQRSEVNIVPAAAQTCFISLTNATGLGLNPIIGSTFIAELVVDGQRWKVTTGGPSAPDNALYFTGEASGPAQNQGVVRPQWGLAQLSQNNFYNTRYMTGVLETGTAADGFRRGIRLSMSGDYAVELVEASYCLTTGVGKPVAATVFAGLDITASLDVNLLIPGSKLSVDSPVRVDVNRSAGISARASDITFNALATTDDKLTVGPAVGSDAQALEVAAAVAEIRDGVVTSIRVPVGFGGAGYDPVLPPLVTISAPESVAASARLSFVSNGYVSSIDVTAAGAGYRTPPTVVIERPAGVAAVPVATARLGDALPDGTAGVRSITVDPNQRGRGYSVAPQVALQGGGGSGARAVANIAGSISAGGIAFVNRGYGYTPNSQIKVSFVSRSGGTGAEGYAEIDANGSVRQIVVTKEGTGYQPETTDIQFEPLPPNTTAKSAVAVAEVDPATRRVVAYKILDGGAGYGKAPLVAVAAPLPVYSAARAVSAIDNGQVTGITFESGTGLNARVNSVDRNTKAVTSISVLLGKGGSNYLVGDTLLLAHSTAVINASGRGLQVRVAEIAAGGAVTRLEIVSGGAGYKAADALVHDGAPISGYGYTAAPKVTLSRPDAPDGIQATATAILGTDGSITRFRIDNPGSGYASAPTVWIAEVSPRAQAERVRFNTGVGASVYSLTLADDRSTTDVIRTELFVSNSGSLAGYFAGTNPAVAPPTRSIVIESHQGDILVAGRIHATSHSYLMQSSREDAALAPFRLSTDASGTEIQTGRILGGTLAVTLANDLDTAMVQEDAVAVNEVSLRTAIESLRVRAARRDGRPIDDPFPYMLAIDETDDVTIDAVAASGFPIVLSSSGDMLFTATLETAAGLIINGVQQFTVTAPVSTTKGSIRIEAQAISVSNSLRVTAAEEDERAEDIVLSSKNGDINLDGGFVTAPNKVVIRQRRRGPKPVSFSNANSVALGDNQAVSLAVEVPRGTVSDDIDVTLSITHPSVTELSATLIAPDKTRIPLFATKTLAGKNLTGTTFDAEATSTIAAGAAPYAGRFQPASMDLLRRAYTRSPVGTWTVEVRDSADGNVGTVNSFTVTLNDPEGTPLGLVYGSSRIQTATLVIDADGSVGDPAKLPGEEGFYLGADVRNLEGYVAGSFALDNLGALNVQSLRAGGLASLRASGTDPSIYRVDDPTTGMKKGDTKEAALRGTLTDVTQLDVSAPNGSIDLRLSVAETIVIGNQAALALAESQRAGKLFPMTAAGSVRIRSESGSTGGDFAIYDAPLAGSSARTVRFAVTVDPSSSVTRYVAGTPGFNASTIRGVSNGRLTQSPFGGSLTAAEVGSLKVGDRLLVANSSAQGLDRNGVYTVMRLGDSVSPWMLMRAADSDTIGELPEHTILAVVEGTQKDTFYRVTYPNGTVKPFGGCEIEVNPIVLQTTLSSSDAADEVRFVVSTTDGTNASPGSLGKMIKLRQANSPFNPSADAAAFANLSRVTKFLFKDTLARPIVLSQELPKIEEVFTIDGALRYPDPSIATPVSIDGSRITAARTGATVTLASTVNGLELSWKDQRNEAPPVESKSAMLRNLVVGGFNRGAAIVVSDFPHATLESLVVGLGQGGITRLGNRDGVVITATSDAAGRGASGVTLTNSEIYTSGNAGVSVRGKASGVTIVGSKIGSSGRDNVVGIEVSTSGSVAIGLSGRPFNAISSNGTGIKLSGPGKTAIRRSRVGENAGDGILITSGEHVIGLDAAPSPLLPSSEANEIARNGAYGIRIDAATIDAAKALAAKQKVFGNFFVAPDAGKGDTTSLNVGGSIFVSATDVRGVTSGELLSVSNASFAPVNDERSVAYGIDGNGNQHFGRGDLTGPVIAIAQPEGDGGKLGILVPAAGPVTLTGLEAGAAKAFVLTIQDSGSGLLEASLVKEAFVLRRGSVTLREGTDYRFVLRKSAGEVPSQPLKKEVSIRMETLGGNVFPLGNYRLEVMSEPGRAVGGSYTGGKLTDAANNTPSPVSSPVFVIDLKGALPPSGVKAVAGDGQVALQWDAPSDDGGAVITGYAVQSSANKGISWQTAVASTNSTVLETNVSVTNGQEYIFRVAAVTSAGVGQYSSPSSPVKPGLAAPSVPTVAVVNGVVTLGWSAPAGATGILRYVVQESMDGGGNWKDSKHSQPSDLTATSIESTVTGLVNGARYVFRVAAASAVGTGNWSAESAPILMLSAPSAIQATAGNGENTVSWVAPPVTPPVTIVDYALQASVDGGRNWSDVPDAVSTATTTTVSATNGTSYVYRVAARTSGGVGEWSSASQEVKPLGPATAPLNVAAVASDARVVLTWMAPASNGGAAITDYVIQSSTDGGARWVTIDDGLKATSGADIAGLQNGVAYTFRVAAITVKATGAWSQSTTPVTPRRPASAPLALSAVAGDAQARLTWTVPASDGGAAITDYAVQRSIDGGKSWVDVVDPVSAATSTDVVGLVNGTSYVFRVAAKTAAGNGAWTAASNAVIPARSATAPRTVQATAGDGYVVLTWLPPESTGGTAVTDYVAQRSTDGGRTWTAVSDGISTATKMTAAGLVNGSAHVFRVAAVTSAGAGAWSAVTTPVVPRGPAAAPLAVQAIAGNGQVVLSWSPPASLGGASLRDYIVQSSTNGGATWSTLADGVSTASSLTVTGLANGTAYVYRVAAVTDFATGVFSAATAAVVPLAAPGAIAGLQAQAGSGQATLRWQAPAANGGRPVIDYTIEYQAVGTTTWTPWAHAPSAATSATITGLAANTAYLFRVRAVTSFASGTPVATAEAIVPLAPPTSLIGRASSGSVALSWLPPRRPATTRIIDYRVQYSVDGVNWITAADGVSAASRTTVRGLTNGTAYLFRVAAVTAKGVGSYSAVSNWLRPAGAVRRG